MRRSMQWKAGREGGDELITGVPTAIYTEGQGLVDSGKGCRSEAGQTGCDGIECQKKGEMT